MTRKRIVVALAGNPNSGKSTIFNDLTGAHQHVGNYPGVTVEKKEGACRHDGREITVVDLPGTYSLSAYSIEELVARNVIIDEKPDVVVDIVDASNLERNLYLAVQIMELGVPLVLAFNMSDVARARGIEFDLEKLSRFLGAPIVPTVGHKGKGTKELLDAVVAAATRKTAQDMPNIDYGREVEEEILKIAAALQTEASSADARHVRWLAVKLLEGDKNVREKVSRTVQEITEKSESHLAKIFGDPAEIIITDRRYGFISGACQEAVRSTVEARHTMSDRIDAVATSRVLGLPIFLGLMYLVFHLTFTLGDPPMGWIEKFFGWLGGVLETWWPKGSESILKSLLVDGIIGGVGGVIVFLPNILLLFLAIAILEDSGYMARAAFIMDRLMHKIGLHGKSFIPMLLGFGCSVPAIMATRTLENQRDRLTTMLVTPLISCGARLPIYALIIPAFFPGRLHAPMLWTIYIIGIVLAIVSAKVLRTTIFRGESTPFVMELPPYRIPTLKGILLHMWERGWLYLKKAGTVILGISILLWGMTNFPKKQTFDRDYETQTRQAEAACLDDVRGLNSKFGLATGSDILVRAIQAELDMAAEQKKHHETEPGFAEAAKRKDAAIEALGRQDGGDRLMKFLEVRQAIRDARAAFDGAVLEKKLVEGTPGYFAARSGCDAALANLQKAEPEVYAAAIRYLDNIRSSFEGAAEDVAKARQAEELAYTISGRIGHALEPILKPLGFDWKIGTALIGAFAAKEVFVAQMGIVYSVGEADEKSEALREKLKADYSPLIAFCIMLFCLTSAPCMATIAITRRESNSWGWALFQLGALTVLAYVLTLCVFQLGSILGIG
ncbi:MAG: ferrous iron transport protein B [Planctomycetes bacterium]|nr:ferrous iron transport protein B [Planctomycetota bacterium]